MTEPDRKQQILQAEEAIRQLADQLVLARQSRTAADEATRNFQEAHAVLERTRSSLQETLLALQENTQHSRTALAEAKEHLERTRHQVDKICIELHALTQQVGEMTPTLQRHLEIALGQVTDAVRLVSQGQERLRTDIHFWRRLTWASVLFGLLAFGTALLAVVLGLRPG
jgi:hypothetical protein